MKLKESIELLNAQAHYATDDLLDADIQMARASDLMSEILAEDAIPDMLVTCLCNPQVVRTAMVFGIKAVVFVRGRAVNQKMIDLALQENIVLMTTPESLFSTCGKLYSRGVRGVPLTQISGVNRKP